jgi:hypothetical protein
MKKSELMGHRHVKLAAPLARIEPHVCCRSPTLHHSSKITTSLWMVFWDAFFAEHQSARSRIESHNECIVR